MEEELKIEVLDKSQKQMRDEAICKDIIARVKYGIVEARANIGEWEYNGPSLLDYDDFPIFLESASNSETGEELGFAVSLDNGICYELKIPYEDGFVELTTGDDLSLSIDTEGAGMPNAQVHSFFELHKLKQLIWC